ncbi:hypothetical protein Cal7507_5270 [Calothrix sp. PCC 7507]|nr:hypothetical protein Cal7507_5270 [Calothrix sp. PCC 7507]
MASTDKSVARTERSRSVSFIPWFKVPHQLVEALAG